MKASRDSDQHIETLMSQEIDKLKIENNMLSERNDHLETKISAIIRDIEPHDTVQLSLYKRELKQQVEMSTRLQ